MRDAANESYAGSMADDVLLHGGPFDGVSEPRFSSALIRFRPPYFCGCDDDIGSWHHYIPTNVVVEGLIEYEYLGLCAGLPHVPSCGQDHSERYGPPQVGAPLNAVTHVPAGWS